MVVSVVQPLNRTASRKREDGFLLGACVNVVPRALLEVKLDLSNLFRGKISRAE